jgi:hypothetical protein
MREQTYPFFAQWRSSNLLDRRYGLFLALLIFFACEPNVDSVELPTKICLKSQHHTWDIPDARIFIKFNVDSFPGYEQPPSYFDAHFVTDKQAKGCIAPVPEGRHWIVAYGYDSLYWPKDVRGSLRCTISLENKPVIDTILYVSE